MDTQSRTHIEPHVKESSRIRDFQSEHIRPGSSFIHYCARDVDYVLGLRAAGSS